MKNEQKALIVTTGPDKARGLDELNVHLSRGWRVVHATPMGGASVGSANDEPVICLAALVIVERYDGAAAVLEQVQEEKEELLDELTEGDGSSTGIPGHLGENEP